VCALLSALLQNHTDIPWRNPNSPRRSQVARTVEWEVHHLFLGTCRQHPLQPHSPNETSLFPSSLFPPHLFLEHPHGEVAKPFHHEVELSGLPQLTLELWLELQLLLLKTVSRFVIRQQHCHLQRSSGCPPCAGFSTLSTWFVRVLAMRNLSRYGAPQMMRAPYQNGNATWQQRLVQVRFLF